MPASLPSLTQGDMLRHGGQEFIKVSHRYLGNGHTETTHRRVKTLSELPDWWGKSPTERWDKELGRYVDDGPTARGSGDLEASRAASARRARRKMRQRCKALGLDCLGTLTYKENMQDRDTALRHFKEFVRRVRRFVPSFSYVAVLEAQKRGALHFHFAHRRLPARFVVDGQTVKSYDLIRAIWRSVIGGIGAFNDQRRRAFSPLRIAKYMGKYIGKSIEQVHELNKRQYFAGGEWSAPTVESSLFRPEEYAAAALYARERHDGALNVDEWEDTRFGVLFIASYSPPD